MFAWIACTRGQMSSRHPAGIVADGDTLFRGQPLSIVLPRLVVCIGLVALGVLVPQFISLLLQRIDPIHLGIVDRVNLWFYGLWIVVLMYAIHRIVEQTIAGIRPMLAERRRGRLAIEGLPDYQIDWSRIPRAYLLRLAEILGLPMDNTDAATVRRTWIRAFESKNCSIKGIALHELHADFPFAVHIS